MDNKRINEKRISRENMVVGDGKIICVIGVGLIGGSLALALKSGGFASQILGVENSPKNGARALELGLIDRLCSLDEGVDVADIVLITTPVDSICKLLPDILDRVKKVQEGGLVKPTVIDVGSTKHEIITSVHGHPMRGSYVAAHPIAGTEYSGPDAALPTLFKGKNVILCDTAQSSTFALTQAERMFASIGMRISKMESLNHDCHVAYVSHLSHLISFSLALSVLEKEKDEEKILTLAAGGFDSTVRLAKSKGDTWASIFLQNREFLLEALDSYSNKISLFRDALYNRDKVGLTKLMDKANEIKKVLN